MKKQYKHFTLFFYFLFLFCNSLFAKFYEIDASNKVINFSSYCKKGIISVFIISEHGCLPCLKCKAFILNQNYDMNKVDIYYCLITKNTEDLNNHKFENRISNKMWSFIEGCTMPPYIYIFGPTGNPISIINGFVPEKIDKNINLLLESLDYYQEFYVQFKDYSNSSKKDYTLLEKYKQLEKENEKLKELNDSLINFQNQVVNSGSNNQLINKLICENNEMSKKIKLYQSENNQLKYKNTIQDSILNKSDTYYPNIWFFNYSFLRRKNN